jgi:two-component sensor histidine kinase
VKSPVTNQSRRQRWYVQYPRAVPLGIFLLISAIIAISVFAIERMEIERNNARLREVSAAIGAAIERRFNTHLAYLQAGGLVFSGGGEVTEARFARFAGLLQDEDGYRGAVGLGWGEPVAPDQIPELVARRRADDPGFTVFPELERADSHAVPVLYLRPETERSRRALGYDMHSEAVRRLAMARAQATRGPTMTGKLVLMQEGPRGRWPGFIIYMPVFDEADPSRLKGFIYSAFHAQRFLASALEVEQARGYAVRLYDQVPRADRVLASVDGYDLSELRTERRARFADHDLVLAIQAPKAPRLSDLSLLTMAFGALVAALLMMLARMVTRQASEDQEALAWFTQQASIRNSLVRELNHRVKNTLANVLSMIALTRRRALDLDSFADSLAGRIRALSATHDLLTMSDWSPVPLRSVVEAELAPYTQGADLAVSILGPDVDLAPNDALSLGLAIHELATNASKFGALSALSGKVEITWQMITEGLARIDWREHGGPPVSEQRHRGFGLDLLEKIVAHELRNPVDIRFAPDGVRCSLIVPVRQPAEFQLRAVEPRDAAPGEMVIASRA